MKIYRTFFYRYSNKESPPFAQGTPHINCGSVEKPCGLSGIIRQYLTSHFGLIFFMMSSFLKEITQISIFEKNHLKYFPHTKLLQNLNCSCADLQEDNSHRTM